MRECNFSDRVISGIEQKKGVLMIGKILASTAIGAMVSFSAAADTADSSHALGEGLAWSVAAYASCETPQEMQADFKAEATKMQSSMDEVLAALRILAAADNVCGQANTFAADMLALAETDMATLEARIGAKQLAVASPVFEIEAPEGAGAPNSIILTASADLPPLSSTNAPTSDYQE